MIPLQIGLLLNFPPLLGVVAISLGLVVLLLWYIDTRLLPRVLDGEPGHRRILVVFPLTLGLFVTAFGVAEVGGVLWGLVLVLFVVGRAIQGAVLLRTVRRLVYYARRVVGTVRNLRSRRSTGTIRNLVHRLRDRLVFALVATLVTVGLSVGVFLVTLLAERPVYGLWLAASTYVGVGTVLWFIWDVRSVLNHLGAAPLLAVATCITGAEVFNYPEPMGVRVVSGVRETVGLPGWVGNPVAIGALSVTDVAVVVVGQFALLLGIGLSALVLLTRS